jgi:hypothetical protein
MKMTRFSYVIGAAIVLSFFAGTASADGKRGRDHSKGDNGYHQEYRQHQRPDYRRPQHFGPKHHHGPKYYHGPKHHREYANPHAGYRHRHPQSYRASAPYGGYGVHLSIFDPYFAFGFSTGGRR